MPLPFNPTTTANRVNVETHLQLARITLTRPPLNVIDFQMMDELLAALLQLEQRSEVSVVIMSGGERAFSAGVDVAVHTPEVCYGGAGYVPTAPPARFCVGTHFLRIVSITPCARSTPCSWFDRPRRRLAAFAAAGALRRSRCANYSGQTTEYLVHQ